MHRGITKRISDLNTGDIMRKIKLAAPLYHERVFRVNVTLKWIKFFSLALISSQREERSTLMRSFIMWKREATDVRESFIRLTLFLPSSFISHWIQWYIQWSGNYSFYNLYLSAQAHLCVQRYRLVQSRGTTRESKRNFRATGRLKCIRDASTFTMTQRYILQRSKRGVNRPAI